MCSSVKKRDLGTKYVSYTMILQGERVIGLGILRIPHLLKGVFPLEGAHLLTCLNVGDTSLAFLMSQ
ncbi:hypothetical protein XELAEV_18043911mg [Xenopus laevis]|uniref:Uncharacterized protein n=1 Tax=Xenopus laevis TaxID=8355 RepID=A0A974BYG6_XENLA|nr:hypothetical protein XELAEV_18043911mg [Xenopus laevis]